MILGLDGARKEVIKKSFAFYNALRLAGCGYELQEATLFRDEEEEERLLLEDERMQRRRGRVRDPKCEGRLCFVLDRHAQPFIRYFSSESIR